MMQPQHIVNCHTAGMLQRGTYAFECSVYPNGDLDLPGCGTLAGISVGVRNRLNMGLSYGGDGIIGRESPRFNPHIGMFIKYRVFEETYFWPAFAVGYDHQGSGGIDRSYNGYIFKSPGFFLAVSKNYLLLTIIQFGVHGGMNYSLEEKRTVQWPNLYCGADLGINEELSFAVEYDLALNARDPGPPQSDYDNPLRGFLNIAVRWFISKSLSLEFDIKDILENKVTQPENRYGTALPEIRYGWDRELKIAFSQQF